MQTTSPGADVRHDPDRRQFATSVDGVQAHLDYQRQQDAIRITRTSVPAAIGGRGIAAELMRAVLDYARAEGLKVIPACSYAAAYIDRHPQYADLRA